MRKTIALLVSLALTGIIGVSAAQAHRAPTIPDRAGCPAAHSRGRGHGHGHGHGRGHDRHRCPTSTTSTTAATTTTEDTSTTQVG